MWRLILYRLGKFQDRRSIIIYCTMGGRNLVPVWHCFHDVLHPMLRLGCAQFGLCCKWVLFPLKNRTCLTMWFWILHLHLHRPFWQEKQKQKPTWREGKTGRRVLCRCCPINKLKKRRTQKKTNWSLMDTAYSFPPPFYFSHYRNKRKWKSTPNLHSRSHHWFYPTEPMKSLGTFP